VAKRQERTKEIKKKKVHHTESDIKIEKLRRYQRRRIHHRDSGSEIERPRRNQEY
jgi:hypothetical protein